MNSKLKYALAISAVALATQAMAQVTFYEGEGFRGRAFSTANQVNNFANAGFNDRTSSVVVDRGRWEVCEHANFGGRCAVLRRGSYDSLRQVGFQGDIIELTRRGGPGFDAWLAWLRSEVSARRAAAG